MRDMLEPVFGATGAVVAQFFIAVVMLLILVGIIYWAFALFAGFRFAGMGRGRNPRLAIIDALAIDSRHRLVLIRRDNVEHLILTGSSANLVVESSITRGPQSGARLRQPQQSRPQHQSAATASPTQNAATATQPQSAIAPRAMPHRSETKAASEPIPFPPIAPPQAHSASRTTEEILGEDEPTGIAENQAAPLTKDENKAEELPVESTAAQVTPDIASGMVLASGSAHFEETTRPSEIEPVPSLANTSDENPDEPVLVADLADGTEPAYQELDQDLQPASTEAPATDAIEPDADGTDTIDVETAPAIVPDDTPAESDNYETGEAKSATKVIDLEKEMVRLLGEIAAKRAD